MVGTMMFHRSNHMPRTTNTDAMTALGTGCSSNQGATPTPTPMENRISKAQAAVRDTGSLRDAVAYRGSSQERGGEEV